MTFEASVSRFPRAYVSATDGSRYTCSSTTSVVGSPSWPEHQEIFEEPAVEFPDFSAFFLVQVLFQDHFQVYGQKFRPCILFHILSSGMPRIPPDSA